MRYLALFPILFVATQLFAQSTVESIPNQKLIDGSYVSNPDNILDQTTVLQIDTLLKSLENKTTVQVAVVAVASIGEDDIFEFTQRLFDAWGIGNKGNDNGLLIMLVKDQHSIRFHTGNGVEGVLPDVICKRIQRDHMVPEFKNENYNAGMLAGIQQVNRVLTDPAYAEELKKPEGEAVSEWVGFVTALILFVLPVIVIVFIVRAVNGKFADSKAPAETPYPEMRMKRLPWILTYALIPVLIVTFFGITVSENAPALCAISLYLYFMLTRLHRISRMKPVINRFLAKQEYYEIVEFLRKQQWHWLLMAIIFPLPFFFYFFYHLSRKRAYRNHPRDCKQCRGRMVKLNDKEEDAYLSKGQLMEETLKAVDYDVWKCVDCQSIDMSFYLNRHSKYEPCPKCKTIAWYSAGRRTTSHATYSSSGSGEETHACKFCGHQKKSTYTIAKLERSTSTSSSGSSFSGSSSSGGSWGGGRSSGGGATSSW
jgi:uncharacterized protein